MLICPFPSSIISCVLSQALVYEHSGQHLEIELFDEDPDKDDFLGRCAAPHTPAGGQRAALVLVPA